MLKKIITYHLILLILISCSIAAAKVNLFENYKSHKLIDIPTEYQNRVLQDIYELKKNNRVYHAFIVFYRNLKVKSKFLIIVNDNNQVESVELLKSYDRRTKKIAKRSYLNKFFGASVENLKMPDAISGATQSSQAIKMSVQYILNLHKTLYYQ